MIDDSSGDAEILSHTGRQKDGSLVIEVQGERFTSDPLPEQLNASLLTTWCDAVRNFAAEAEARRREPKINPAKRAENTPAISAEPAANEETPQQYVRRKLEASRDRVQRGREDLKRLEEGLKQSEAEFYDWQKIAEGMGVKLDDEEEQHG